MSLHAEVPGSGWSAVGIMGGVDGASNSEGNAESPMAGESRQIRIRRELAPDALREQMARDVRRGLASRPKSLPPKYFYDARGSRLFEAITRLPEYYLTRAERSILQRDARELLGAIEPRAVVEYGSGTAGKTEILLEALRDLGRLDGYAPIDVSSATLRASAERLVARFPGLRVEGVVADFESRIELPFAGERRLVLFLGSTIGNFEEPEAVAFLERSAGQLGAREGFLLGLDLVKDRETLEAAYDDDSGVTAEFNRNVLRVLNRELEGDFPLEAFRHSAVWDADRERVEMHLVARSPLTVRLRALDLEVRFEEGESVRTELSHKYTRESAERLLRAGGLDLARWETDAEGRFALALARPR